MPLTIEEAIGQKLMLTFTGLEPSAAILATLARQQVGGVTLFRADNVESPAQVRALTTALQRAAEAAGQPRLIIAADQEGGTLLALAGSTPFPGNLALGAAGVVITVIPILIVFVILQRQFVRGLTGAVKG